MNRGAVRARTVFRDPVHFLAFGFGAGLAPKAPGTFGTLVAIPLYWLISGLSVSAYTLVVLGVIVAGVWICGRSSARLGVHDHPGIVWDEIAGYLMTMMFAPPGWLWMVAGFALFRFFDILKPPPIRWLDRNVSGGLGIMLDDVLAGFFALLTLETIEVMVH